MIDFSAITACGECCTECPKKLDGRCPGCIEADGRVPEWAESGRCRVHACTWNHRVPFCGLCTEFPCDQLSEFVPWNPDIIRQMSTLRKKYRAIYLETDRLILRDYTDDDFEVYYKLKSDAQVMYYLQDIQMHSPEEAKDEFTKVLSDQEASSRTYYFLHMD